MKGRRHGAWCMGTSGCLACWALCLLSAGYARTDNWNAVGVAIAAAAVPPSVPPSHPALSPSAAPSPAAVEMFHARLGA